MAILFAHKLSKINNRVLQIVIKATELILLSAGLISTLLIVKGALSIPYSCEFVFSSLVGFWNSIRCILSSPLYICIIINLMVVLIAVSSSFHNHDDDVKVFSDDEDSQDTNESLDSFPPPPTSPDLGDVGAAPQSTKILHEMMNLESGSKDLLEELLSDEIIPKLRIDKGERNHLEKSNDFKKTAHTLNYSSDVSEPKETKNPPSHDEEEGEVNNNHEDDEYEEEDTIDATWRSITGGGTERPNKKELKKSETFVLPPQTRDVARTTQHLESEEMLPSTAKWKELRKSETFNDAVSIRRNGGLRRDSSMSLDEFNNQVEAFIKNFNDDMRLQRQESDQRFIEMINQGL